LRNLRVPHLSTRDVGQFRFEDFGFPRREFGDCRCDEEEISFSPNGEEIVLDVGIE
jgi:hypothetical protein